VFGFTAKFINRDAACFSEFTMLRFSMIAFCAIEIEVVKNRAKRLVIFIIILKFELK
jgi:hypothetical protein